MGPKNIRRKQALMDEDSSATVLAVLVTDVLSLTQEDRWWDWDPETVRMEVEETFNVELPEANFNKLMAAQQLITSDGFYQDLPTFIQLCNALYNGTIDTRSFDPADAAEISWGITEALLLWPPDPQAEKPFSDKIVKYIGKAIHDEGIMQPPDVLRLGILENDGLWDQVQGTFSDDPIMFAAIYDVEMEKTEEINQMVKGRLRSVLMQLDQVDLDNGTAEGAIRSMLAALKSTAEQSDEMQPATGSQHTS
jgi:hypothetical protein